MEGTLPVEERGKREWRALKKGKWELCQKEDDQAEKENNASLRIICQFGTQDMENIRQTSHFYWIFPIFCKPSYL